MSHRFHKIRVDAGAPVRTITLHNPERRNAIGPVMVGELNIALDEARADEAVRVVVLTGEGAPFCAGGDFGTMHGPGNEEGPVGDYADMLLSLLRFEKPVIARVQGAAMGGGLGLVAASTFAYAEASAKLGTPEIDVGLFPMMIMAVLARLVPRRTLIEMMLAGQRLTAEEARAIGIVNRVFPTAAELDAAVSAQAAVLASKSPTAMSLGLRAFAEQEDLNLTEALPLLRDRLAEALGTADAREGLTAFLEKRKPVWTGR